MPRGDLAPRAPPPGRLAGGRAVVAWGRGPGPLSPGGGRGAGPRGLSGGGAVGLEPGPGLALLSAESYFGRGVSSPERLLERAAALGHTHLALTDWQSLTGGVRLFRKAREVGVVPACP
jgi:hypothetical protein